GQCFLSGNSKQRRMPEGALRINMKRFWDRDALSSVKRELRANRRLRELLMESACESLLQAGQQHFALEKLYASCMDFQAQDRFTRSFCEKLFLKG
ncbi:MAG: hypothetical protein IJY42_03900, partial [Clostridia bacterium]|nr:hypothetical protein [Clostridia bacterium]